MDDVYELKLAGHPLHYAFRYPKTRLYFRSWLRPSGEEADILAPPEEIARAHALIPDKNPEDYAEFKALCGLTGQALLRWDCCIFHAVAFRFRGRAWLLTAPSGTGKTTQFMNWRRLLPAEITMISGDMPVLERKGDAITVHPSPWNGKESIGSFLSAPLGGVVLLEQGRENRMERIPTREAIIALMRQFVAAPSTEEDILSICAMLDAILHRPFRKLVNTGDLASTELLRETLKGDCNETV